MPQKIIKAPKLPRISLVKVFSKKTELFKAASPFIGQAITGGIYRSLCQRISEAFSVQMYQKTIERSLLDIVDVVLTEDALKRVCWRLAAHSKQLANFVPCNAWLNQPTDEWMPLQVVESVQHFYRPSQRGSIFTFRILAGSAASMLTHRFWTKRFCYFMSKDLGFSRSWGSYPFKEECQLVGLRLWGLFEPKLCSREDGPKFDRLLCPSSIRMSNRAKIKTRFPSNPEYNCPRRIACHLCPQGMDTCSKAIHTRTYVELPCKACGNERANHDPKFLHNGRCIECELLWKIEKSKEKGNK